MLLFPNSQGWGDDGHSIVCKIAQGRLSDEAGVAVKKLLPKSAENDLAAKCSWADHVRHVFPWSSALHFANTPDSACTYKDNRDCVDQKTGAEGRCIVAAITNYTNQLLEYGSETKSRYNLTQALMFLSHFMGDIHQPLHCGFTSDKGGNTITVHWYRRKQNLHHIWDDTIIETQVERFHDNDMGDFVDALQKNITRVWADEVEEWENCGRKDLPCPATYASESTVDACKWAYKDAPEGSVLEDDYFLSRYPIVNLRLAQGGVRLAATLNRIFDTQSAMSM
ncbi:endonuclease 2-like [Abrus precatorius]|uniref:Aspergillus nuclease S1 n=1 Tax=Abrus precatorius TaxID=3816 RepID=A0A8B8LWY2_ABRPR|nr:endonuclease 2-like [Abrus precatorius]XP_027360222.1 endonuclease 2-like [Abrus precatorius]